MLYMNQARMYGGYFSEAGGEELPGGGDITEVTVPVTEPAKTTVPEAAAVTVDYSSVIEQYAADKPALQVALGFLGEAGIDPAGKAFELAKGGDFTLLKAELAKLGKAGSDQMVAILESEVKANAEAAEAHEAKTTEIVQGILGESHEQIIEWARSSAEPEEKAAINELLEAGGFYAHCAAVALREAFQNSDQTIPAKNPVQSSVTVQGDATPLTAAQFSEECQKLSKANSGEDPRRLKGYAQLQARRVAGRNKGI